MKLRLQNILYTATLIYFGETLTLIAFIIFRSGHVILCTTPQFNITSLAQELDTNSSYLHAQNEVLEHAH